MNPDLCYEYLLELVRAKDDEIYRLRLEFVEVSGG